MKPLVLSLAVLTALTLSACDKPQVAAPAAADAPAKQDAAPAAASARAQPTPPAQEPAATTKEFPTLQVTTVDGQPYELAQQRGHWVVVNFWATWCKPCLKEMPELSAMAKSDKDTVRIIGLAYDDIEDADLKAFVDKNPVDYPLAKVDVYNPPADFETPRGLPMTYLIAPDGRVAKRFLGPVTPAQIREAITAAPAAGKQPA
ncbi:TlpA family protein disulfide reductase [Pseudoxanthomonas composti]|uniref:TlpA family protein disulfide reductase n=1 Tax=Pseudoxanthomonas composti TaxID=2137479 RepID=A0A4Q1JTS9_9GAMM|nr:TlpA disulfide reductase family protein [Pseudoxanthomonas composti]RXR04407.1 TlpA family protein disulfide reductase [Pseudoxanthomonas composti]